MILTEMAYCKTGRHCGPNHGSLLSDKCYLFQPLYESQNLKSHNRFSSSSGTSQGSGDPVFYNKAPPGGQQPGMSSISNNLTELDQLLSDLNSAQFLAEVDKKHPSGSIIVSCQQRVRVT